MRTPLQLVEDIEKEFESCKHPYTQLENGVWCNICGALWVKPVWLKPHWRDILWKAILKPLPVVDDRVTDKE
jgi:hypothetical protein